MNANDELKDFTGTGNYYRHVSGGCYTDGVQALCERFECYWFLDVVFSYQYRLKAERFQTWTLNKNQNDSATVICTDGNHNELQRQEIKWTDFERSQATIWVVDSIALLPSEY